MQIRIIFVSLVSALLLSFPAYSQDFEKDSDHDGFPDAIEQASGFNPDINEPLKKCSAGGKCGELKTDFLYITSPETVLLVLDISGSMSEPISSRKEPKIDIAKKILSKYIDSIPLNMQTGLVIYGKRGCEDDSIEVVVPICAINKKEMKDRIAVLKPSGSTPIAAAVKKAPDFFKGFETCSNRLILVSDGGESCGGDPVQAITDFKATQYNPQVTVIGLNVDSSTRKQLSKIADASDGSYSDVKSEEDLIKAFASFFDDMNNGYKEIVCIVNQYNVYLKEETEQYNKTNAYLVKAITKAKSDNERNELKAVQLLIQSNHEKRIKAKDELSKKILQKQKDMEEAKNRFLTKK